MERAVCIRFSSVRNRREKGDGKTAAPECRMKAKGASGPTHSMKEGASRSFSFIEPMKALPVDKLPGDWLYEIKHDGYRALAFKDGKDVRLILRNDKPLNYPQVLDSLKLLAVEQAILDGEIAALDEKGRSSFPAPSVIQKLRRCPAGVLRLAGI